MVRVASKQLFTLKENKNDGTDVLHVSPFSNDHCYLVYSSDKFLSDWSLRSLGYSGTLRFLFTILATTITNSPSAPS